MDLKDKARALARQGMKLKDVAVMVGVTDRTLRNWGIKKNKKAVTQKAEKGKPKKRKEKTVIFVNNIPEDGINNLTEKEQFFCEYYVRNFNATQAAIKAGYSPKTAYAIGFENLKKPKIREYIDFLKNCKRESIMIDEDDIVEMRMRIAFADITDFVEFGNYEVPLVVDGEIIKDDEGKIIMTKENGIRLKDSNYVDGSLISVISTNRQGTRIKLEDRQKALDWLANYFEMNPEHQRRKEYDKKRLALERQRFEHQKKMDEDRNW